MSNTKEKKQHDIVLIHSLTEDGAGVNAVRSRPDRLDFAELRPAKEGQDVSNVELVRLRPRDQAPFICDVDVLHNPDKAQVGPSEGSHDGPARISSDSYRKNWDLVFGVGKGKTLKSSLLN